MQHPKQTPTSRKRSAHHIEPLEPRTLLASTTVDIGPTFHARQPGSSAFSATSSTSASTTFALSVSNPSVFANLSGTSLAWNDNSARYSVSNPRNFLLRDSVSRAGDITLTLSALAPGNYTLTLHTASYGSTGTAAVGQFDVRVTDLTRTSVTVLSAQRTMSRDQLAQADITPITFSPKADASATIVLRRTSGTVHLNGFTLSDGLPDSDTTAPTLAASPWSAAPYPVKAGTGAISMSAARATDANALNTSIEYYFENTTSPNRNSGWVATPSWTDLDLPANSPQSYRYRTRDTAQNLSPWSPSVTATTFSDNSFAGFSDSEIGPRDVAFSFSGVRYSPAAPEVGVHPRIFTSPDERDELRARLATTTAGQEISALISAYTRILTTGSANYSSSANYALDPWGTARINNVGYYDVSALYNSLVAYNGSQANPLPFKTDGTYDGDTRNKLASLIAVAAYECWLYQGQPEYDTRAINLANAATNLAYLGMQDPEFGPNDYNTTGGMHLALAYDFLYNVMTPFQRTTVRTAIVGTTWTAAQNYGEDVTYYANTSNWTTLNDFVPIMMMAVEGEPGFDADYFRTIMRVQYNFLTYGFYETGATSEGLGKSYQMLSTLHTFSRRGYFLTGHPHVRAFATNYLPNIAQPYGYAFSEYDDWGGSGRNPITGDYKFAAEDAVGAKWIFPTDPAADFVLQNYMGQTGNQNPYANYMLANTIGQKSFAPQGYYNNIITSSIFASDFNTANRTPTAFTAAAANANDNELTLFEPNRGLLNTRSDFSQNALAVNFSSRQDLGGHTHADRNNFNLSALGRMWAIYRTESSATDVGRGTLSESQFHSLIHVDGIAQAINAHRVAKQPGKIVSVVDTPAATFVTGDAKYAYEWKWNGHLGSGIPLGPGALPVTETLNNFRLIKHTEPQYDEPLYDRDFWNGGGKDENYTKEPYNPMRTAYRTTGVVRGPRPYALVLDDYQKDDQTRNYKWYMQLADDLTLESTVVSTNPANYRNDVILAEPSGNRRLLVRVLQNNGQANPAAPATIDTYLDPRYGTSTWKRLLIESNSANPQFKVMLFPFTVGQTLPTTSLTASTITNTLDGRTDTITYSLGADGRTRYSISQNGVQVAAETTDSAPSTPLNLIASPRSQSRIELNWTPTTTNEQLFRIERSTDAVNFTPVGSVLAGITTYLDLSAQPDTLYHYRVTAANSLASAPTPVASARTWPAGISLIQRGNTTYTQNFNTLISSAVNNINWAGDAWLPGWSLTRSDTLQLRHDSGTQTFPRPFSQGSPDDTSMTNPAVDRAFGGMAAGNGYQAQGMIFRNDSGHTVARVDLAYAAEQWRQNVNTGSLKFYYKLQDSNPTFNLASTNGWTELPALSFAAKTGPATPLDGNAPANRTALSTSLPLSIPAGQFLVIGWRIIGGNNSSNPTLAVDDVSLSFHTTPTITAPLTLPSTITTASTPASLFASDFSGDAGLTYSWSITGGPTATAAPNQSNPAKLTTLTFTAPGTYTVTATATNKSGISSAASGTITVLKTATAVAISSPLPRATSGRPLQLTASLNDQFAVSMPTQPTFAFTLLSGGGTLTPDGVYTASLTARGPAMIKATVTSGPSTGLFATYALPLTPANIDRSHLTGIPLPTPGPTRSTPTRPVFPPAGATSLHRGPAPSLFSSASVTELW